MAVSAPSRLNKTQLVENADTPELSPIASPSFLQRVVGYWRQTWDADFHPEWLMRAYEGQEKRVEPWYCMPFLFLHAGALGVFFVGWSWPAVAVAFAMYWVRMFALTGFYHRYFSHRTYSTNRFWQFMFAVLGMTAIQKGPLWWAAHHRNHHRASDQPTDSHSPIQRGFWYAHVGWITSRPNLVTDYDKVKDLAKYPELRFLNRFDGLIPTMLGLSMLGLGYWMQQTHPEWGVTPLQMLVWGFFVSTVVLFHAVSSINTVAHMLGYKRYDSGDESRNSFLLAVITMGEGWHNNHHAYQGTIRQGFHWWQIDATYYVLWTMSKLGIIWDLHPVPEAAYQK